MIPASIAAMAAFSWIRRLVTRRHGGILLLFSDVSSAGLIGCCIRSTEAISESLPWEPCLRLLVLCISYAFAEGLLMAVRQLPIEWGTDAAGIILLYFCISPRTLAKAGQDIYALIVKGDLSAAREHVGYIVGRDTAQLDESDAARATIETVAENTVDGVVSTALLLCIGRSSARRALSCSKYNGLDARV